MARMVALITLVAVLGLVNWSIFKKEDHLANGRIVYLHLAPIDPRSLMQGDYMALNFRIGTEVYRALPKSDEYKRWRHNVAASDGYVIVKLDEKNVATFEALYNGQTLADKDILLRYRVRNGAVKFATNAFFFQEGNAKIYQPARYGQFRVDAEGELLLVSLYDKDLKKLEPMLDRIN
jgi:uncharacterized membrane-anchored protein